MHRMHFLSVTMPKDWHPKLNVYTRRTLLAAKIAVKCYLGDVKANIRAHVEEMINEGLHSLSEDEINAAQARRQTLRKWLRSDFPLGYGDHIYPALLRAITPNGCPLSMPLGNADSMSTLELATLIYAMVRQDRPKPLQAPLIARSASLTVFRVAVKYMHAQALAGNVTDQAGFVIHALAEQFDDMQVAHVPWSAPAVGTVCSRKVTFRFWRSTGKRQERGERAMMKVVDAQERAAMTDVLMARQAALMDAKAPWTLHSLTIGDLPSIQHKHTLPEDFTVAHATLSSDVGFIAETYEYVSNHYDGNKPIHKFALLVSLMFARMAPNLLHGPVPPGIASRKGSTAEVTAAVRSSPWISEEKQRRGVTATLPFIVMVTTYIIALAEEGSPLRVYMCENKGKLGDWAKKHGT